MATQRQINRASNRFFNVAGYGQVEFSELAPTGYALVRRAGDASRGFGTFCLNADATADLLAQIEGRYAKSGRLQVWA